MSAPHSVGASGVLRSAAAGDRSVVVWWSPGWCGSLLAGDVRGRLDPVGHLMRQTLVLSAQVDEALSLPHTVMSNTEELEFTASHNKLAMEDDLERLQSP